MPLFNLKQHLFFFAANKLININFLFTTLHDQFCYLCCYVCYVSLEGPFIKFVTWEGGESRQKKQQKIT